MVGPQTFAVEAFTPEVRGDVMSFGGLVAFRCARIPHFRQWCAPWLKPIDTLPRLLRRNLDPKNIPKRLSQEVWLDVYGNATLGSTFIVLQVVSLVGYPSSHHHGAAEKWVCVSQCISNCISIRYTLSSTICTMQLSIEPWLWHKECWLVGFSKDMFPRNHGDWNHISYSEGGVRDF